MQHRLVSVQRGPPQYTSRLVQTEADDDVRRGRSDRSAASDTLVRDADHQVISDAPELGRGGAGRNVPCRRVRPPHGMKPEIVAKFVEDILSCMDFPSEHWLKIRTNNGLERIMKEIRRRASSAASRTAIRP